MSPAKPEAVKRRNSRPRRWADVAGRGDVADKVTRGNARRQLAPARILSSAPFHGFAASVSAGGGPPTLGAADAACDVVASEFARGGVRKSRALRSRSPHRGDRTPDSTSPAGRHVL